MHLLRKCRILHFLISLPLFSGCAFHEKIPAEAIHKIYMVQTKKDNPATHFAPVFLVYNYQNIYNRIGRPSAIYDECGREQIYVDAKVPVIYYKINRFKTGKGVYTNYIYRIHFPEIPFSLFPFHLTAGKNVGLMVFVTVNAKNRPILISTVHTCGCYVSIIPTCYLPSDALPENWKNSTLKVYGERLPWKLEYTKKKDARILVHLRPAVHRVMNLEVIEEPVLYHPNGFKRTVMKLIQMETLDRISINGKTTSFYHKEGLLKGYVKGSQKFWESTLMSIFSMDFFVGMDKAYADSNLTGNPFYTSLKPWNRNSSDMWDFAAFLKFWGWRL